jgi:hypothetical protein
MMPDMQKQGCSSTDLGGCTTTKRVNNFFITWNNIPCVCWSCWMLNSHRRSKEENHWLTNVFCWAWQGLHSEFGWHAWTLEQWPISVRCSQFVILLSASRLVPRGNQRPEMNWQASFLFAGLHYTELWTQAWSGTLWVASFVWSHYLPQHHDMIHQYNSPGLEKKLD